MREFSVTNLGDSSCSSLLVQNLASGIMYLGNGKYQNLDLSDEKAFWEIWDNTMTSFDDGPGYDGEYELSDFAFLIFYTIAGMEIEEVLGKIGCLGQTKKADKTGSLCTLWTIPVSDFEKARLAYVQQSKGK